MWRIRHLMNSFDVFVIKGFTVWKCCFHYKKSLKFLDSNFPSGILQFCVFVWKLRSWVYDVFLNHFLLIDATDRSRIRRDQNRFFTNTPFSISWEIKTNERSLINSLDAGYCIISISWCNLTLIEICNAVLEMQSRNCIECYIKTVLNNLNTLSFKGFLL